MDSNPRTVDVDVTKLELDSASKDILINSGRAALITYNNWPKDVNVTLNAFYLCKDQYENTDNPRFAVHLIGKYKELDLSNRQLLHMRIESKGAYRKNELDASWC